MELYEEKKNGVVLTTIYPYFVDTALISNNMTEPFSTWVFLLLQNFLKCWIWWYKIFSLNFSCILHLWFCQSISSADSYESILCLYLLKYWRFFDVIPLDKCVEEILDAILKERMYYFIPQSLAFLCNAAKWFVKSIMYIKLTLYHALAVKKL